MKTHQRRAMSMIEVVIALSLFSMVMVAVLQAMVSATSYVEFDSARTDLEAASMRFQTRVLNDFANAAWLYRFDDTLFQAYTNPITNLRDPLFPRVSADRSTIEFLKLRTSLSAGTSPKNQQYAYTNFRSPDAGLKTIDFSDYIDAAPTALMIVNPEYVADPQWFVSAVWENNGGASLNFKENQHPENLRHYLYVVEPNSRGSKSLVRKYINGYTGAQPAPSAWTFDEVLIDEVTQVEFATWLEEPGKLGENQVRMTVLLERKAQGTGANSGTSVTRRIDFTTAMRSINQE